MQYTNLSINGGMPQSPTEGVPYSSPETSPTTAIKTEEIDLGKESGISNIYRNVLHTSHILIYTVILCV